MIHLSVRQHRMALCLAFQLAVLISADAQTATMALGYRRSINTDWMGYNSANVIRDSMYLTEPHLMDALPQLHPKIIRYPGGSIANWWDWKKGWFINSPNTPAQYLNIPVKNNGLDSLKKVVDATGATPIFCLNMVSSTMKSQLKMLDTAIAIGLPVKYVELGNEFYLDEESDSNYIYSLFPDGATYGTVAAAWCDSIHNRHPEIKVAAQGAFNRNNATRRVQWDTSMYRTLQHEDVISFHSYFSAAPYNESADNDTFVTSDVPIMMYRPFKMWKIMASEDMPLVPPGNEVWITEYNLQDHYKPVHGSWAHGLFIATQTLQYLNDSRITHLACHAMCGSAVYGMYFNTLGGFHFGGYDGTFVAPPSMLNDTCQLWGLTAAGRAMKTLGIAIEGMTHISPLQFIDAAPVTTMDDDDTVSYPSLYGWLFTNDTASHAIFLNLSPTKYIVKVGDVFPSTGSLVEYYADPVLYVDSESNISSKKKSTIQGSYQCDPYSITYMRSTAVPAPPPTNVNAVALGSTTICEHDSVQLDAGSGYEDYQWSTGDTTRNIWAKQAGDYVVAVRTTRDGYQALDTINITTLPAPIIPKIKSPFNGGVCENGSAELSVKIVDPVLSYDWNNGTNNVATTITAAGYYTVTAIDSNGCKSTSIPDTIISIPAPVPVISPSDPADACYDEGVTLDAGDGYKSYAWSNGTLGQVKTFKNSGSYTVTVKDDNNCYGTSAPVTITIHEPGNPTITITGPTTFCDGTSPTELKTISGYDYQWLKGSNMLSGATNKKYSPDDNGTYKVVITDDWGCTKKSDGVVITLLDLPSTKITLTGTSKICEGIDTTILNAKDCTGCTFQWKKGGVNINGATDQTLKVTYEGDYKYVATNSSGCSATSDKKSITSKNCRAGYEEDALGTLSVYPNPAWQNVHVEVTLNDDATATITLENMLGEEVLSHHQQINDHLLEADLDLSAVEDGLYLLIVKSNSQLLTQPLVVERK